MGLQVSSEKNAFASTVNYAGATASSINPTLFTFSASINSTPLLFTHGKEMSQTCLDLDGFELSETKTLGCLLYC
jgi:hypothetical protein